MHHKAMSCRNRKGSCSGAVLSFFEQKNKHGQIEFVPLICLTVYNKLIINNLQSTRQIVGTNSICPCFIFGKLPNQQDLLHYTFILLPSNRFLSHFIW